VAAFIAEIVGMPTVRKAIKDKEGQVVGHESRTRFVLEPRQADDDALVGALFEMMGESVKVTVVLEQGKLATK
jgi:hypothetical protein